MQILKEKLNSKRGASIILVLALFLICTMVSSVILAAAASGTSRNAQRVEQQQSYLAVSSAANMLQKDLQQGGKYVGAEVKVEYGCILDCVEDAEIAYVINNEYKVVEGKRLDSKYIDYPLDEAHLMIVKPHDVAEIKDTDETTELKSSILAGLLERAAEKIYLGDDSYSETIVISMDSEERLPEVRCDFTMDKNYNIKIQLVAKDSTYAMNIFANADVTVESREPVVDKNMDLHQVYYKAFQEDGSFKDVVKNIGIDVTTTSVLTTVEWKNIVVQKGVLADE